MSKQQILMVLGCWVIIFLFLGFPSGIDKMLALLSGVAIIGLAYQLRVNKKIAEDKNIPFVEHKKEGQID